MRAGLRPFPSPPPGTAEGAAASTPEVPDLQVRIRRLSGHLVIALVILVVIGGATRVMEAGLACPDWPLCYGVLLPGRQMNLQVFLEWFHRLDAFVVGVALLVMTTASLIGRRQLPAWLPWLSAAALLLVAAQGLLGAFTVSRLLASGIVTAHLAAALTLLALVSGIHQALAFQAQPSGSGAQAGTPARPWRAAWIVALAAGFAAVMAQCLLGGWMASHWAADRCLAAGEGCNLLALHRQWAYGAGSLVLLLSGLGLVWPLLSWASRLLAGAAGVLVLLQIALGVATLRLALAVPAVTIAHQLSAALLVAVLAAQLGQAIVARRAAAPLSGPTFLSPSGVQPW